MLKAGSDRVVLRLAPRIIDHQSMILHAITCTGIDLLATNISS